MDITKIATIHTDFPEKFGVPRQSGLVPGLGGRIVMEKEFRRKEAFKDLEGFSHVWLIWGFSENGGKWQLTVRPPRLGGNRRVGVFASRSPFRPNGLGLSAVRLVKISYDEPDSPVLYVDGVDMTDNTPIYDIKPYNPVSDRIEDAAGGFADGAALQHLEVEDPKRLMEHLAEDKRSVLKEILSQDPRPHYQNDPDRVYGFYYAGKEIKFKVSENSLILVEIIDKI